MMLRGLRRTLVASLAATAVFAASEDARAWYFPEHAMIAHDGVLQLRPEVRAVLDAAIAHARAEGLPLCPQVADGLEQVTRAAPFATPMVRAEISVPCVPYSVLSALAGDHASSATELLAVLRGKKGLEISSAAAFEWRRFREALDRLPNTTLERMSFVHNLDVAFYFIDPGYHLRAQATRAHFAAAGQGLDALLGWAADGNVDNALGQFLAHHVRSLELAARAQPTLALLEHGFAMHFLQDAFAAGHLAMAQSTWTIGNERIRRRHDYFNALGLPLARAMSAEPCATLDVRSAELPGLPPCWVTSGDGYLAIVPDASDRLHAARAVAKAEWQLALALDPERVLASYATLGERDMLAQADFVEPVPWWTVPAEERRRLRGSATRTATLLRGAAKAVERLRTTTPTPELVVGGPRLPVVFDPAVLTGILAPCVARDVMDPALATASEAPPCGPRRTLALGTVGVSLLRPILAEWPEPQEDVTKLHGESKEDLGWAVQLIASTNAAVLFPRHAPVDFYAPAIGVSGGLAYRWGTYLPGRLDRAVVELNVGVSSAIHYDSAGRAGGAPQVTTLDEELRWPVLWELLTSYNLPMDLSKNHGSGQVVFVSGARAHEVLTSAPVFFGFELETVAVALTRGQGSYPLYAASPEIRLYVGAADPTATQPSAARGWGPTFAISLTGGYATFL